MPVFSTKIKEYLESCYYFVDLPQIYFLTTYEKSATVRNCYSTFIFDQQGRAYE